MRIIRTLHGKLSAVLLLLLLLIGALMAPLTLYATRSSLEEVNQRHNRDLAAQLAKILSERDLLPSDFARNPRARQNAGAEIKRSMTLNPNIEIYVLNTRGTILSYSAAPGRVRRNRVSLERVRAFLAGGALPIRGDDPRHLTRQKIFSAAPIPLANGRLNGFIYIVLDSEELTSVAERVERSTVLRLSLWTLGSGLIFVFGFGTLLFFALTRRLRALTNQVETYRAHPAEPPIPSGNAAPRDEIERLERVFCEMAARISSRIGERETADLARRDLLGNVSHDLRTPLAALQGYLETLLMKQDQLSPTEQRQYLQTVSKHAARLNRLISALFDLAKLDSGEAKPQLEPFSLGELVQDLTQRFQLRAQNAGIALESCFPRALPLVMADIGLIERALENLIDNALRFTPSGGQVAITLELRADKRFVDVTVSDSGAGISPADLPHIFERSFRARPPTGAPEGAGLGLAITKRILELHGSTISAHSEPGKGAVFAFSLPVAV